MCKKVTSAHNAVSLTPRAEGANRPPAIVDMTYVPDPSSIGDPYPQYRAFKMMAIRSWNPQMTEAELEVEYLRQQGIRILDAQQSLASPLYRKRAEELGIEEYFRTYTTSRVW